MSDEKKTVGPRYEGEPAQESSHHGGFHDNDHDADAQEKLLDSLDKAMVMPSHMTKGHMTDTDIDIENGLRHRRSYRLSNEPIDDDEDVDDNDRGSTFFLCRWIEKLEEAVKDFLNTYSRVLDIALKWVLLLAYLAYFGYSMYHGYGDEGSYVLIFITIIVAINVFKRLSRHFDWKCSLPELATRCTSHRRFNVFRRILRIALYLAAVTGLCSFLGLSVFQEHPENVQSFVGIMIMIVFSYMCSNKPSKVQWHPVFWGFMVQFAFAVLTLRSTFGYRVFKWLGDQVRAFVDFSDLGSAFVISKDFKAMGLAFSMGGIMIFFNSVIFVLTHWGVVECVVVTLGRSLSFCLGTGPIESLVAASNVFLSLEMSALLIRPYISKITRSELHTVITCGFASISGGVLAMFIRYGAPPNHLLTAAVISAPAALAMSKVIYPETEKVNLDDQKNIKVTDENSSKQSSALQMASEGAVLAVTVNASVWSNMLAFVSILGMIDHILDWFGRRVGIFGLSFQYLCSYILYPLSYVMGVRTADCGKVGTLVGIKLFATPVMGYYELGELIKNRHALEDYVSSTNGTWHWSGEDIVLDDYNQTLANGVIHPRSEVISTYAICGFSAFTAIGICLGAFIPVCPERKQDILNMILTAFFAGNMASFVTGAVAGVMYSGE